jgi:hypothetical protein
MSKKFETSPEKPLVETQETLCNFLAAQHIVPSHLVPGTKLYDFKHIFAEEFAEKIEFFFMILNIFSPKNLPKKWSSFTQSINRLFIGAKN